MPSPTQRSLEYLRKQGFHACVVERWNAYARVRQDLFGFIDIVAVKDDVILGVQSTTSKNISNRLEKARGNLALASWIRAGGRIVIHGWGKRSAKKASGTRGRRKVWEVSERVLGLGDVVVKAV